MTERRPKLTASEAVAAAAAQEAELTAQFAARRCSTCGGALVVAVRPGSEPEYFTLLDKPTLSRRGSPDFCSCLQHLVDQRAKVRK